MPALARANATLLAEKREGVLTAREREVLSWVAQGKTNGEVAGLLSIAPSTVRKHLENVYAKLGVPHGLRPSRICTACPETPRRAGALRLRSRSVG